MHQLHPSSFPGVASTMSEYESSLAVEASVHGSGSGYGVEASFEASAGYDSFSKDVAETNSERFEMTSFCFTSVAGLNEGETAVLKPTQYLAEVAAKLPKVKATKCHLDYTRCVHLSNGDKTLHVTHKEKKALSEGQLKSSNAVKPNAGGHAAAVFESTTAKTTPEDAYFSWDPKFGTMVHMESGRVLGIITDKSEDNKLHYKLELKDEYNLDVLRTVAGSKDLKVLDKWEYDGSTGIMYVTVPREPSFPKAKAEPEEKKKASFLETSTQTLRRGGSVSCGSHRAPTCAACPSGHGASWCNGACVWNSVSSSCENPAESIEAGKTAKQDIEEEVSNIRLALHIDKDGKVGLWEFAKDKPAAKGKEGARLKINRVDAKEFDAWAQLFRVFGTHYLTTVHLGGKMVYTCDLSSSSVEKMESEGVSASLAVEASYEGVGVGVAGGASASMSKSSAAASSLGKVEKTEKTIVIGGKPAASDPGDPAAFGEWAETVADHPMPVKYSLRPLSAIGGNNKFTLDFETYNLMLELYEKGLLRAKKEKNAVRNLEKGSASLMPGQSISSGMKLKDHVTKAIFAVKDNGLMTITDKFNNVLWDSGTKVSDAPTRGPFTLTYQMDGDLVLTYKDGTSLWRSNTKFAYCGNVNPQKVILNKGSLEIHKEGGGIVWTTATTKDDKPHKANGMHFMCGDNKCSHPCVQLFRHGNYQDLTIKLGAGDYDYNRLSTWNGGNDDLTSFTISNGCELDLFEHDGFGGTQWKYTSSTDLCAGGCNSVNDQTSSIKVRSCSLGNMGG